MGARAEEVLRCAAQRRVLSVFCSDVTQALAAVRDSAEQQVPAPTLVALQWEQAPGLAHELTEIRDALADAAAALWPDWYLSGEARLSQSGASASQEPATVVSRAAALDSDASPAFARAAWERCATGALPVHDALPLPEQVRQLSLAMDPQQLLFVLCVASDVAPSARVRGVARAAEWLVQQAPAQVVLLLPAAWRDHAELDHVSYGALDFDDLAALSLPPMESDAGPGSSGAFGTGVRGEGDTARPDRQDQSAAPRGHAAAGVPTPANHQAPPLPRPARLPGSHAAAGPSAEAASPAGREARGPQVRVGPIVGRPHPSSAAEWDLYERIQGDAELRPLFEFNQLLEPRIGRRRRARYIVDLLWRAGGLVVELDGDEHRQVPKFYNDRERDYRLCVAGYATLRIPNHELFLQPDAVLSKIRTMVRLRDSQLRADAGLQPERKEATR